MEIKYVGNKISAILKKYRYGVLVLAIGIILMMIPVNSNKKTESENNPSMLKTDSYVDITQELTETLSQMQGVGDVKIMLTVAAGEQVIYQVDENISSSETGSTIQKETVIITGSDRQETALISYVKPPTYLGVIVVCEGADQPSVKLAVVDAVSKITGLGSDKISVVKMK